MRLLACLLLTAAAARAEDRTLAVLDFRNKLEGEKIDSGYFADVVRSDALKTVPGLRVITRENLLVLLQSTGKDLASCEGECEVDTGRRIGADLVISGDLLRIGSSYKLNLRLHETRGGQLLSGVVASGKTVDELDAALGPAVTELLQPLREAQPLTRKMPEIHNSAPVEPRKPSEAQRKVGFGLLAGSVLLGAGAGYFALKGKSLANDVSSGNTATADDIVQKAADSKKTNTYAYILTGAGGAALIAGVILVLLNPAQAPVAMLSQNGLLVAGRF